MSPSGCYKLRDKRNISYSACIVIASSLEINTFIFKNVLKTSITLRNAK